MSSGEWRFSPSDNSSRLRYLGESVSFESLGVRTREEMSILCAHPNACRDKGGFLRAVYCVKVSTQLFDLLFNSHFGYRAAYFKSPSLGLSCNRQLLNIVSPRLVDWTRANCSDLDSGFAEMSLAAESAKMWLAEPDLVLCDVCEAEWNSSAPYEFEIINGRWEIDDHAYGKWGRRAYLFKKLRFIGGFLNDDGEEYVAPHKRGRAEQISKHGWS